MNYKYDIYAAGPFFNDDQKETMDRAIEGLRLLGFDVCDPRDLNPVLVEMAPEERKKFTAEIFRSNCNAIEDSYMIVACIDDRDPGTAFEMGFAHGQLDKRHFGCVTFSGKGYGCNVMLSESSEWHWGSIEEMLSDMERVKFLVDARTTGSYEFSRVWGSDHHVKAEAIE